MRPTGAVGRTREGGSSQAASVLHTARLRLVPDVGRGVTADPQGKSMDRLQQRLSRIPRCGACSVVIGVYEPLVRVLEDSICHTSRAAEPDLHYSGEGWYHLGCFESLAEQEA